MARIETGIGRRFPRRAQHPGSSLRITAAVCVPMPGTEISRSCLVCRSELVPKNWTDGLALDLISNTRERIRRR